MLMILNEKVKRTPMDIEAQYPNCKYLLTGIDINDLQNISGYLYAVSTDIDSFSELCDYSHEFKYSCVMGSYNNGGAIGVQYVYKIDE